LLAFCNKVRSLGPAIVVHENVPSFPAEEIFGRLLGDLFYIFSATLGVAELACGPVRRPRRYTILFHQNKVTLLRSPAEILECLRSALADVGHGLPALLVASRQALVGEIHSLCERRGFCPEEFVTQDGQCLNWEALLTEREAAALLYYRLLWLQRFGSWPETSGSAVFNLGDNPWTHCNWSANHGGLPTYRRGSGKFWVAAARRWLLASECWASLGLPVFGPLAAIAGVPVLEMPESRGEACSQMGNAMHVPSVGVMILVALTSCGPR
jgi:hypothetical protein